MTTYEEPTSFNSSIPYAVPTDLQQWAVDMEVAGGLPSADTTALEAWGAAEGGSFKNTAYANVLNTTVAEPGSTGTGTQGDIQNFNVAGQTQAQDWQEGIYADLATLDQANFGVINNTLETDPSQLPDALATQGNGEAYWGTNPELVANIMGQSPDQIQALSTATGTSSGGGGVITAGGSGPNAEDTSLVSSTLGTAASFFGIPAGSHIMVRGAFALFGLILLIIALKEMFNPQTPAQTVLNVPGQAKNMVKNTAKRAGEAGAVAAA